MLSWSTESLLVDGRSQGEIRQGVTTQIFGEGSSMGPLNDAMKRRMTEQMGDMKYDITWTTLAEYLAELERRGVSQNVASFIGATTIREHVIGLDDRKPTAAELDEMRAHRPPRDGGRRARHRLVADLRAGVLCENRGADRALQGRGEVPWQVHLAHAQRGRPADRGGRGADSHRREAGIPAEIYHLKAAGEANWAKMPRVIALVEEARRSGLRITADMYTYTAGATGLDASMPPWVLEGGYDEAYKRLRDPDTRKKIAAAIARRRRSGRTCISRPDPRTASCWSNSSRTR